jgi:glycosyltransferase involved in cell wall biosynthesis
MLISFIIPHRNSQVDLIRCIKSIPDKIGVEVIIVDDKSEIQLDIDFIKRFKNKIDIRVFTLKKNMGAGHSRNVGLKKATGKWIVFADADDYFLDSFNEMIARLNGTKYDLHYFKVDSICNLTGEQSDRHVMWNDMLKFQNEKDLRFGHVVPWGKIISRKLIEENSILFDEIMYSNDITFSTKVGYFSENLKIHDLICYCVTKQPNTLHSNLTGHAVFSRMIANVNRNLFLAKVNHVNYRMQIMPFFKTLIKGGHIRLSLAGAIYILQYWLRNIFSPRS